MADGLEWVRWTDDWRWHRVETDIERSIDPDGTPLRLVGSGCGDMICEEDPDGFVVAADPARLPKTVDGWQYGVCEECRG